MLGRAVRAGLEQDRVAGVAELRVDLLGRDLVDLRLDLVDRLARVEDDHVRAEVDGRVAAAVRLGRGRDQRDEHECDGGADGRDDPATTTLQRVGSILPGTQTHGRTSLRTGGTSS